MHGPAPELPASRRFASERLVEISSGNARLVRAGARLDGRAADFGRAFWNLLETEAPLSVAALRTHGIREIHYVDRYLLTPLSLRLLFEVIRKAPGGKSATVRISSARASRTEIRSWAIFHNYVEDAVRRAVLEALLPGARVDIRHRTELPHERSFRFRLGDGRVTTVLLDQGFGAWRTRGAPPHDFTAEPAGQARSLKSLNFEVGVETGQEAPIVLEEGISG